MTALGAEIRQGVLAGFHCYGPTRQNNAKVNFTTTKTFSTAHPGEPIVKSITSTKPVSINSTGASTGTSIEIKILYPRLGSSVDIVESIDLQ